MNRVIVTVLLIPVLLLCVSCSKTAITETWKDPLSQGRHLNRVFVVAITANQIARRNYEETFVMELGKYGIKAFPSYRYVPGEKISKDSAMAAIAELGVQEVLITTLVGIEKNERYNPPRTYIAPRMGIGYYGYYYRTYDIVHEPGYYTTQVMVNLETTIYDATTEKPLWSARSETMNPDSSSEVVSSAIKSIVGAMKKDGLV